MWDFTTQLIMLLTHDYSNESPPSFASLLPLKRKPFLYNPSACIIITNSVPFTQPWVGQT